MELVEQSNAISRQLPSIVESDYYVQIASIRVIVAKLKSLAFALEQFESIEQAMPFLKEFWNLAEMDRLAIYDRTGKRVFGDYDSYDSVMTAENVQEILRTKVYTLIDELTVYDESGVVTSVKTVSPAKVWVSLTIRKPCRASPVAMPLNGCA